MRIPPTYKTRPFKTRSLRGLLLAHELIFIALIVLAVYGPSSTVFFSITLIVGMIVGTYSSIFVASNILTYLTKK